MGVLPSVLPYFQNQLKFAEMAEQLTAEEIKALQEKAAEAEALKAKVQELEQSAESTETPLVVKGTFKHKGPNDSKAKDYKFKKGAVHTRLSNGQLVRSEHLLALANGKSVTEKDIEKYPQLVSAGLATKEGKPDGDKAKDILVNLIEIGYGLIE